MKNSDSEVSKVTSNVDPVTIDKVIEVGLSRQSSHTNLNLNQLELYRHPSGALSLVQIHRNTGL